MKLFILIISFIVLYIPTFRELIELWATNEDYGHGFLILPISLYLVWRRRDELSRLPINPSNWGIALIALWGFFYVLGSIGNISNFTYLSLLLFPIGTVLTLFSGQAVRKILFPTFFLLFMFPVPSEIYAKITNPLLLISTNMSFKILTVLNLPVLQEGNILTLPNYTMKVVLACSGIRSIVTIMALALLVGYLMTSSNIIRAVIFIISIPIAILGNVLRITVTALLAHFVSLQAAEGYSHTFAGLVTFAVSLIILYGSTELILWLSNTTVPTFNR